MGMTIEKAIPWLEELTFHEGDDVPIYDTDVEAISIAIDIIRKYQKIQQIVKLWEDDTWTDNFSYDCMVKISEVMKDGNNN